MTNIYKVVGIQIVPKNNLNNKNIINQVAWNRLKNCRALFEKLIIPTNNSISKKQSGKKFNVVGIISVNQGTEEALFDMKVSSDDRGLSSDIMQYFNNLVRTLN